MLREAQERVRPGDAVDFVVGYGDVTAFLHDVLYGVRQGRVEKVWPVEARYRLR